MRRPHAEKSPSKVLDEHVKRRCHFKENGKDEHLSVRDVLHCLERMSVMVKQGGKTFPVSQDELCLPSSSNLLNAYRPCCSQNNSTELRYQLA
ncbi:unnamed protein product [Caretta caretta]